MSLNQITDNEDYRKAEELIDAYLAAHSDSEPDYLAHTNRDTHLHTFNPRKMSGQVQGRMLKMFAKMMQAKNIIEIGTFTGYAALCLAEGTREGGHVDTLEIDDELEPFILKQFAQSPFYNRISLHIGDAINIIPKLDKTYDLAFIDADKRQYRDYYELLLPKMRKGGIMLIDNTLWDGKVVVGNPKANDRQTRALMEFNDFIATDTRVEKVMLPLRDGMTVARKID